MVFSLCVLGLGLFRAITHYSCSTSLAMLSGALCDLVTSIALMVGV